jgi:hypothetical protein
MLLIKALFSALFQTFQEMRACLLLVAYRNSS